MSTVAIAWAVLDSRVSATGLGLVFTATVVPQVLLLPLAGAIADRLGGGRGGSAADVLRSAAPAGGGARGPAGAAPGDDRRRRAPLRRPGGARGRTGHRAAAAVAVRPA